MSLPCLQKDGTGEADTPSSGRSCNWWLIYHLWQLNTLQAGRAQHLASLYSVVSLGDSYLVPFLTLHWRWSFPPPQDVPWQLTACFLGGCAGLWRDPYRFTTSSFQPLSWVWFFAAPWTAACQASLSFTIPWSLLKLMSIESVMPSSHLILCNLLLLLPSIFPNIRVFSNESVLHIRWPKYWNFSFSIISSKEYSRLISFKVE